MNTCGIYGLVDPNTKEIRYVGSSKNCERRFKDHCVIGICKNNLEKLKWLLELKNNKQNPELVILETCNEEDLVKYENIFIEKFKSNKLLNMQKAGNRKSKEEYEKQCRPIFSKNLMTGEVKFYNKISDVTDYDFELSRVIRACKQKGNRKIHRDHIFWYKDALEPDSKKWKSFNNLKMLLYLWAKKLNITLMTLHNRLGRGWSIERTLGTPRLKNPDNSKIESDS